MAVHNGEDFVAEAVTSILEQTFENLEVVVVDDGSSDESAAEVLRVADDRVSLVRLRQPSGDLALALAEGVSRSSADLIARMDADDISVADRIERQVDAMRDPALGLLGTWVDALDKDGVRWLVSRPPCEDEAIRFILNYRCPFHHPSMMLRRGVLEGAGGYRPGYRYAEDYDLWRRMIRHGRAANLPEVLLRQRYYVSSTSGRNRREQDACSDRIGVEMVGPVVGHAVRAEVIAMLREQVGPSRLRLLAGRTLVELYLASEHSGDFRDQGILKRTAADELVDIAIGKGAGFAAGPLWKAAIRTDPRTAAHRGIKIAKEKARRLAGR
jgi:hypothetical protein